MRTNLICGLLLTAMACAPLAAQDTIVFEDFEDATLTYTTNLSDALGGIDDEDFYGRVGPGSLGATDLTYNNVLGDIFYGVSDTDGNNVAGGGGATDPDLVELNWSVETGDYEDLALSWYIAEDDDETNEDWDTTQDFNVAVSLDGGSFDTIFSVRSVVGTDNNQTNELPRVDTDFDGVGDGAEITDTFTQFSAMLANASTVDIRVQFIDFNAGDEDLGFDNLLLEGTFVGVAVPEPGSAAILAAALFGMVARRRRS